MRVTHNRPQRVGESIQREIARLLTEGLKDPRIGFVTVTGVKVTADLRDAVVYYSCYGTDLERKATRQGLVAATGYLQRAIASHLRLRNTPHLRFVFDESIQEGDKIERLLHEVKRADAERTSGDDDKK